jgi:hypothetical protein
VETVVLVTTILMQPVVAAAQYLLVLMETLAVQAAMV